MMLPPRIVHRVRNCVVYQLNYKVILVSVLLMVIVVVLLAGGSMDPLPDIPVQSSVDTVVKRPLVVKVSKRSESYAVEPQVSCWGLDCDLPNNYHAKGPCGSDEASNWMEVGVKTMERYLQGDRLTTSDEDYMNRYLEDAAGFFHKAIESDPVCARAHINLGLVNMEQQKFQSALRSVSSGIELKNDEPRYYAIRSFINELLSNDQDRIKDRETAVRLDPYVCERKYFGILLCNTTAVRQYLRFPQILMYTPQAELVAARKFLTYIEFSSVSISNYALVQPGVTDFFVENKYTVLRKIIPPFLLREIQKCYRTGIDTGRVRFMDKQSIRYVANNDRVGRLISFNLVDLVRKTIAHNAKPSYCYFGGYVNGSYLNPHSDRPQCEFTFSVTLQQNPFDEPWPLGMYRVPQFEKNDEWLGRDKEPWPEEKDQIWADLYEGDGLLFMGRHMIHFRKGFLIGKDRFVNQIFLHYVQDNFEGTLD